jgi:hypothetical protein
MQVGKRRSIVAGISGSLGPNDSIADKFTHIAAFLAPRIVERAAMPKEIIILESLPLTNVGKPLKSALRQDIAERTFRDVLAETTGLSCDDGGLDVAGRAPSNTRRDGVHCRQRS